MKILKELNEELFSIKQETTIHSITVLGRKKENKRIQFEFTSKPTEEDKRIGIRPRNFIITTMSVPKKKNTTIYKKIPTICSKIVFQDTDSELYSFIVNHIKNKKFYYLSNKKYKYPRIRIKGKMYGKIIQMNTPTYIPHYHGKDNHMYPITTVRRNPKTGKYEQTYITKGSYKFFADDDDVNNLEWTAENLYLRNVEPWIIKQPK